MFKGDFKLVQINAICTLHQVRILGLDAVRGRQDPPVCDDAAAAQVLGADDEGL